MISSFLINAVDATLSEVPSLISLTPIVALPSTGICFSEGRIIFPLTETIKISVSTSLFTTRVPTTLPVLLTTL